MIQTESILFQENLQLSLLCGEEGMTREITKADLNRPGLELAGCIEFFDPGRIQVFGGGEMHFLYERGHEPSVAEIVEKIFTSEVPCAIITNDLPPTDAMLELSYYDKKRMHNLKYFTWVEQQGKSVEELDAQWYDHDYWKSQYARMDEWDAAIEVFNEKTGLLK